MDHESLVMSQLEEGAELVKSLRNEKSVPVSDAYWLFDAESGNWSLRLVVPDLEERGIRETYIALGEVVRERSERARVASSNFLAFEPIEVRLEGPNDGLARAVQSFAEKQKANLASVIRRSFIEGHHVDDMYIYRRDMRLRA